MIVHDQQAPQLHVLKHSKAGRGKKDRRLHGSVLSQQKKKPSTGAEKKKNKHPKRWPQLGVRATGVASPRDHIGRTQHGRPAQQLHSRQGPRLINRGRRQLSGSRVRRRALRVMRDDLFNEMVRVVRDFEGKR